MNNDFEGSGDSVVDALNNIGYNDKNMDRKNIIVRESQDEFMVEHRGSITEVNKRPRKSLGRYMYQVDICYPCMFSKEDFIKWSHTIIELMEKTDENQQG